MKSTSDEHMLLDVDIELFKCCVKLKNFDLQRVQWCSSILTGIHADDKTVYFFFQREYKILKRINKECEYHGFILKYCVQHSMHTFMNLGQQKLDYSSNLCLLGNFSCFFVIC